MNVPSETFPLLAALPFVSHTFTLRTSEDTKADDFPQRMLQSLGFSRFATAEQTHGNGVAVVPDSSGRLHPPNILRGKSFPGVDALVTRAVNLPLVIRCADCAGVFIVDRATPAIALAHSGKRGTLANVVGNTVATMREAFGTDPRRCVAVISPSIGPCHYEMDLWSGVETQLREAGVLEIQNPRVCTACRLDRYFSYRAERGHTGRMFAVLALRAR
jgi:copper oxidase (laccase) domain-containing protein